MKAGDTRLHVQGVFRCRAAIKKGYFVADRLKRLLDKQVEQQTADPETAGMLMSCVFAEMKPLCWQTKGWTKLWTLTPVGN